MITIAAIAGACPQGAAASHSVVVFFDGPGPSWPAACKISRYIPQRAVESSEGDYRVITEDGSMGLNEVAIGIAVPSYWVRLMSDTVGPRRAAYILQTGPLLKSKDLFPMCRGQRWA